jgi:flagellar hook-basal body complex protein FliE
MNDLNPISLPLNKNINEINNKEIVSNKNILSDENVIADKFKNILEDTQNKINITDDLTLRYAKGEDIPVHSLIIAAENARLSIELVSEIRNKIVDSYNELTRNVG